MKDDQQLGALVEGFVNQVSHPRGRVLNLMARASVTVPQVILLRYALTMPESAPSSLAGKMRMSPPSVSQMIERLVRLGLLARAQDRNDRRRKTIAVTAKGRSLLTRLSRVRAAEYATGAESLSAQTRARLIDSLAEALREFEGQGRKP
jgi:DNA-binding MarR family transcriptional regulator